MALNRLLQSSLRFGRSQLPTSSSRPSLLYLNRQSVALISTTKKKSDGTTITGDAVTKDGKSDAPAPSLAQDFSYQAAKKKFVSFGFHWESAEQDLQFRNFTMFWTVSVLTVGIIFVGSYYPDVKRMAWAQREAYIVLARREALGLPPIDENLVPIENINLPSEEELGDFEIIV